MTLAIIEFMHPKPPQNSHWLNVATPSLSRSQKHWLFRPGALTAGLRQLGEVKLRVVREHATGLPTAEAWMLRRPHYSPIWVREIVMSINNIDSVFARSFTPLAASHSLWQGMRRLQTRPLADMLYNDPEIARSAFFACRLNQTDPMYRSARRVFSQPCPQTDKLLARCSVFQRRGQPLLVAECFLPQFWSLTD